jgi:hypothetical protein
MMANRPEIQDALGIESDDLVNQPSDREARARWLQEETQFLD